MRRFLHRQTRNSSIVSEVHAHRSEEIADTSVVLVQPGFLDEFEGALLNRKSTTWRGLDAAEREEAPITLLLRHPTLMKRPVIQGKKLKLGWGADVQAVHLG